MKLHVANSIHPKLFAKSATVTSEIELKGLKAKIHQLRTQVCKLTVPPVMSSHPSSSPLPLVTAKAESSEDKNIQALKKEVVKLRKQVSVMSVKPQYSPATGPRQREIQSETQETSSGTGVAKIGTWQLNVLLLRTIPKLFRNCCLLKESLSKVRNLTRQE